MSFFSIGVYAQSNTQTPSPDIKTKTSDARDAKVVFSFSQELEDARMAFEHPELNTGARTSSDPEYRKNQYLRRLNGALRLYADDAEKIKIINAEIKRINTTKQ